MEFRINIAKIEPKNVLYFFKERRLHSQVLGDHIEAEQVSVNAGSSHGHSVEVLVRLWSQPEQVPAVFFILGDENTPTSKHIHHSTTNTVNGATLPEG